MPIRTGWLVQGRVIYFQLIGDVSRENPADFAVALEKMLDAGSGVMHLIGDASQLTRPDMNLGHYRSYFHAARRINGYYLVFGQPENTIANFLYNTITKMLGVKSHTPFETYAELRQFLQECDPTLAVPAELPNLSASAGITPDTVSQD